MLRDNEVLKKMIALACVSGCRRFAINTAGPSPMREVRSAASAAIIQMSPYKAGETYSHPSS